MIVELTVENIAIIERCQIALGPGLTVLTGETGAGKSLFVDAIELALGDRADSELVRSGASKTSVSAALDLSEGPALIELCDRLGLELDGQTLFIHREVFAEGRSQCRIGGKMAPVSALRQVGRYLVDLHGQHDHQSLLDPAQHGNFLDAWIGASAQELLLRLADQFSVAQDVRARLAALQSSMREREHRLDLLRFQVSEIEAVDPRLGEMEELESQLSRQKHAAALSEAVSTALNGISYAEGNAGDQLRLALKAIEGAARFDLQLEPMAEGLRNALVQLEESCHDLARYAEGLEANPSLLEEIASRIDALRRLRRKYGEDEARVRDYLDRAREELDMLSDAEAGEQALIEARAEAEAALQDTATLLSELRQERAPEFAELVRQQLRDLAMDNAEFAVRFATKPIDASGMDAIEFFFSANAGEPPRPLSRIASGGEISRVMLAIKTAMAGRAGVPTLIFDEVDSGLGGKAAATVARKLEELGRHYQVIVISHLPQIAARASSHFRIEKRVREGRESTSVERLGEEERVREIARMLAGEHVTETALANAREMLGLGSVNLLF